MTSNNRNSLNSVSTIPGQYQSDTDHAMVANPYSKYADCMEEIKKRTEVVNGFFTGKCHAMYVQTTAESVSLQIRKILELIALASLAA